MTEAAKRHAELQSRKAKFANLVASVGANPEPSLPLASVVAVTALMDIPAKGCTKAVATVEAGGFKRHVAVERESFHEGDVCVLFATNACVRLTPVYEKWRGELSTNLDFHYKKYGVKVTYLAFRASRQEFRYNPGILIPASELPEIADYGVGEDVTDALGCCLHNDAIQREGERIKAEKNCEAHNSERENLKRQYYRARDWRAHTRTTVVGKAPRFVTVSHFECLADHPEYFDQYRDTLFDVTEKYNGLNLTVYYSADDGNVHLCRNGVEIANERDNYFWGVIRRQGIDRSMIDMDCEVALEGVVVGPSVRGGLFEGRVHERFSVFNIFDNEDGRLLDATERLSYCKAANIPHVQFVAREFPLFQKAPTLLPLLKTAARPNARGGIRYGLVFRATDDQEIGFQLPNPDYRPCPQQLEVDSQFITLGEEVR